MAEVRQQFTEHASRGEYAQNKAHDDVAAVLDRSGFERIWISRKMTGGKFAQNVERIKWILRCPFWRRKLKRNATVLVQYTISCWHGPLAFRLLDEKLKAKKNLKIVALIHDINRNDVLEDRLTDHEKRFFAMCDKIFVHCENMKEFFVRHGIPGEKLQIFEAFDYLTDVPMNPLTAEHMNTVNICGNLSPHKCGCYKDLKSIKGVDWLLYGPNFSADYAAENVRHLGEFPPDVLPGQFKYGWGLIWDGDSIKTQSGLFGAYQHYIHSHKFSLYLAAGLPVIVWRESGVAKFVEEKGVGIAIGSLAEIPQKLASFRPEEYSRLRACSQALGRRLREGMFCFGKFHDFQVEERL